MKITTHPRPGGIRLRVDSINILLIEVSRIKDINDIYRKLSQF
jgi:hypothetical protein